MSFGELAGSQNIADSVNVRICHFLQSSLKIPSPTKNHGQNAVLHSIYAANQLLRAILAKRESGELLPHPLEFHQRVEHEPFFLPDPLCVFFWGTISKSSQGYYLSTETTMGLWVDLRVPREIPTGVIEAETLKHPWTIGALKIGFVFFGL